MAQPSDMYLYLGPRCHSRPWLLRSLLGKHRLRLQLRYAGLLWSRLLCGCGRWHENRRWRRRIP